jgi:hypothetical protein
MNENEIIQTSNVNVEQKESLKLIRNTKGYTWEIRILNLDIDRLESINNDMQIRFKNNGE